MTELEKEIQELRRELTAVKTRLRTVMDYLKNDVCEMSGTDYCNDYCSLKCGRDMDDGG